MPLDDAGMRRLGHAFVYRIIPVLAATILYGIYIALLFQATHGLRERGLLKSRANSMILFILYFLFLLTTTLWALEVAQLFGLNQILFHPNDLSTDSKFNSFYDLIASETRVTGILFETQMIVGDIIVIWRSCAIWHDRRIVWTIPLFFWALMIMNMSIHAAFCRSGVSTTDYSQICKATDVSAPVLSIVTNLAVMMLTIWKAWILRDMVIDAFKNKKKNKILTLFVLLIESGTLYVIMLVADLLITSFVTGDNETVPRMISCISGYSTVQFVAIYPTLMIVVLRRSVWNASEDIYIFGSDSALDFDRHPHSSRSHSGSGRFPAALMSEPGQLESGRGGVGIKFAPVTSIVSTSSETGRVLQFNDKQVLEMAQT